MDNQSSPVNVSNVHHTHKATHWDFLKYLGIALIVSAVTIPPSISSVVKSAQEAKVRIACIEHGGRIEWNECVLPSAE